MRLLFALPLLFWAACTCGRTPKDGEKEAEVAIGRGHICLRDVEGSLRCWGDRSLGQVGDGLPTPTPSSAERSYQAEPFRVSLKDIASVSARDAYTCAISKSGEASCWGTSSPLAMLSGREAGTFSTSSPTPFPSLGKVRQIAIGSSHGCVLGVDGHVRCFGSNAFGELGDGTREDRHRPVEVQGITDAVALAVAVDTCALHQSGEVSCWGGTRSKPTKLVGLAGGKKLVASTLHTCVLHGEGTVSCFGGNDEGQLGAGEGKFSDVPLQVSGISKAVDIAAGDGFTCVAHTSGEVTCWGKTIDLPDRADSSPRPRTIEGVAKAVRVFAGGETACALLGDGRLMCFGSNDGGQLRPSREPVRGSVEMLLSP